MRQIFSCIERMIKELFPGDGRQDAVAEVYPSAKPVPNVSAADIYYLDDLVKELGEKDLSYNGVAEVYSVPRVNNFVEAYGLSKGFALDILTGWNFNNAGLRKKARELISKHRR